MHCLQATVVEVVCESHHVHGHSAAIGTVEHPLLCEFGVKGNFPEALEVESIEEDQAGLITERSRCQELRDGTCRREDEKMKSQEKDLKEKTNKNSDWLQKSSLESSAADMHVAGRRGYLQCGLRPTS